MSLHRLLGTWALALSAGLPLWAQAHSNEYLAAQTGPHGGQLRMAGNYHLELVLDTQGRQARLRPVRVYVTDHAGQAVPTTGTQAEVTLQQGKAQAPVVLRPDGDNRLQGQARYAPARQPQATVRFTASDGASLTATFGPAAPAPAMDHSQH